MGSTVLKRINAEVLLEQGAAFGLYPLIHHLVEHAVQARVGIVMSVLAEQSLAVGRIRPRIEDVGVPELVYSVRGRYFFVWIQ